MNRIKFLVIGLVLTLTLVGCKKETTDNSQVKEPTKKVEITESTDNTTAPTDSSINSNISRDNKEDIVDLLEDIGELDDREVNDELELVEEAENWISELAENNATPEDIKTITEEWIATAPENKVTRFKEAFPKLNDYALGLIKGDANILELYRQTDDDGDEVLDDRIVTEEEWTNIYNIIISTIG